MLTGSQTTPDWGDDWLASLADDEPIPADVKYDFNTMRYRHIKNAAEYSAALRKWIGANPQLLELFGI